MNKFRIRVKMATVYFEWFALKIKLWLTRKYIGIISHPKLMKRKGFSKNYMKHMQFLMQKSGKDDIYEERIEHLRKIINMKESLRFDGDILITDPCYLVPEERNLTNELWHLCLTGPRVVNLEILGISYYMTSETFYGDWGCTAFKKLPKGKYSKLGTFCADAGLVCVTYLKDAEKISPSVSEKIHSNPHMYCIIKNFHGSVRWVTKTSLWYHRKHLHFDIYLEIHGKGDKKSFSFVTRQTSL